MDRLKHDLVWFAATKPELLWTLVTATVLVLLQSALILRLNRRLRTIPVLAQRLERLSVAMNLLTDTVETGLASVSSEVQFLSRRTAKRQTSRGAVGKRVVAAARRGEDVSEIAREESLSESEVRLHLALAASAAKAGALDDHLRA